MSNIHNHEVSQEQTVAAEERYFCVTCQGMVTLALESSLKKCRNCGNVIIGGEAKSARKSAGWSAGLEHKPHSIGFGNE